MSARSAPFLACMLGILLCSSAFAGFRTLEWNPSAGATGYKVHYGDESGNYSTTIDVTDEMVSTGQGTIRYTTTEDLWDCTRWFFAVTAYNVAGESDYSNEVPWLTPMAIDGATADNPGQLIMQGEQFPMTVSGVGFQPGAVIEVNHPDWACPGGVNPNGSDCQDFLADLRSTVRLESPTVDCYSIQVLASIEPVASDLPALIGDYEVTITNPDSTSVTNAQSFEVLKDPARFDINQSTATTDGRLDGNDIVWLSKLFLTCYAYPGTASMPCSVAQASPDFEPDYDFNGDGWIDGTDLADLASFMGHCWDGASWKVSACN